jgi:hypothetical protein
MSNYTVRIEEDENGDLILPLPDEMLKELGWGVGTTLYWHVDKHNQSIILTTVSDDERGGYGEYYK